MRDIDVRRALLRDLRIRHPDGSETRFVEELGLCRGAARVDVAVVNGSLHGYEIKSERDTLERLPAQLQAYNQAFDCVTVVASQNHLKKVESIVPPWWGLQQVCKVGSEFRIEEVRESGSNPQVHALAVVQLLWRDEALDILEECGLAFGFRGKTRDRICEWLVECLPKEQLRSAVRARLKARKGWRADAP